MKAAKVLSGAIWLWVVGGNVVNTFTISPEVFMGSPQLPWAIVFLPIVVVVGAYVARGLPGERTVGAWVDHRWGDGTYRQFMRTLRPELMFAAMCLCIVLSVLARKQLSGTLVLPPGVIGFFVSGAVAFVIAYLIRRRRDATSP